MKTILFTIATLIALNSSHALADAPNFPSCQEVMKQIKAGNADPLEKLAKENQEAANRLFLAGAKLSDYVERSNQYGLAIGKFREAFLAQKADRKCLAENALEPKCPGNGFNSPPEPQPAPTSN